MVFSRINPEAIAPTGLEPNEAICHPRHVPPKALLFAKFRSLTRHFEGFFGLVSEAFGVNLSDKNLSDCQISISETPKNGPATWAVWDKTPLAPTREGFPALPSENSQQIASHKSKKKPKWLSDRGLKDFAFDPFRNTNLGCRAPHHVRRMSPDSQPTKKNSRSFLPQRSCIRTHFLNTLTQPRSCAGADGFSLTKTSARPNMSPPHTTWKGFANRDSKRWGGSGFCHSFWQNSQ